MPPKVNSEKIISQIRPLFDYLQKQKENQKFIRTVELGATFILISFFAIFAIKPTIFTISSLIGEIKSKELLTSQLKTKINNVILAQDAFSQVQEKYDLIESCLPTTPHFSQAYEQLNGITSQQQLLLNKINFTLDQENTFFSTSISTTSSYSAITSIISDLTHNRRLIKVNDININLNKITGNTINFSIPLNIFYWPENEKK